EKRRLVRCSVGRLGLDHAAPSIARIVFRDACCNIGSLFPQIFLIDGTVLADDEGHDSRIPISGWVGENCEAASHLSVRNVIRRAAGGFVSLFCQDLEIVAVEGLWLLARVGVADGFCKITK